VPIFADPIEWDNHRSYESLTIVTHDGESYTSKCNVGPGVDITNSRYWAKTGAYNAQVEQYKNEVKDLSSQVSGFASDNAEFREKIDQFTKDNAEMKNTVAEDKARVDALAERVATAESEIDGLQATTAQHTTEIADLHAKDEDLQRQITSNDGDIAAIQAKNTEQDSRLNGIDTKLKSHDASIAQNTADIAKNTKNIQDNAANIAKNAHELADHAAKLADHEGRLTAQHEEITANHEAIERLTSVTDGLRADLTEDEAKIESNRDAIAHIQEKDVQQDGRLDKLEECCEQAKAHFTQLDTKTDATNTALTAEIDRAKAAELANGKLIAKNAAELATHATELADHETRISILESDNTTNKQEIADIKAKNTAQDTAIAGNTDAIQHLTEGAGEFVTKTAFNTDQKRQDDIMDVHAGQIAKLEADIGGLFQNSVEFSNIEIVLPHAGVPSVTASYTVFGFVFLPFLRKGKTHSTPNITVNSVYEARVLYFDGTTATIPNDDITIQGIFGPGNVCLRADIPSTSIPNIAVDKPLLIHLKLSVTVSEPVS
jgi:chromosome segregation ATPase